MLRLTSRTWKFKQIGDHAAERFERFVRVYKLIWRCSQVIAKPLSTDSPITIIRGIVRFVDMYDYGGSSDLLILTLRFMTRIRSNIELVKNVQIQHYLIKKTYHNSPVHAYSSPNRTIPNIATLITEKFCRGLN